MDAISFFIFLRRAFPEKEIKIKQKFPKPLDNQRNGKVILSMIMKSYLENS